MNRCLVAMLAAGTIAACDGSTLPSAPSPRLLFSGPPVSPTPTTRSVSISAKPTIVGVGETVSFIVAATVPATSVELSFGDGTNMTLDSVREARFVHIFRAAGTYVVSATASDASGHTASVGITITVTPRSENGSVSIG
jgi:PKD repeat protein